PVGCVGVEAQDNRELAAQLQHAADQGGVVPLVAARAADHRGLVQALAQFAVGQLRHGRLAGGVEQGDDVLALVAAGGGGGRGGADLLGGQALELFGGVDHQ